jgi:hypothetical protein
MRPPETLPARRPSEHVDDLRPTEGLLEASAAGDPSDERLGRGRDRTSGPEHEAARETVDTAPDPLVERAVPKEPARRVVRKHDRRTAHALLHALDERGSRLGNVEVERGARARFLLGPGEDVDTPRCAGAILPAG